MPLKGKKLKAEIGRQQTANRLIHARRKGVKLTGEESGKVSSAFNRATKRRLTGYR